LAIKNSSKTYAFKKSSNKLETKLDGFTIHEEFKIYIIFM